MSTYNSRYHLKIISNFEMQSGNNIQHEFKNTCTFKSVQCPHKFFKKSLNKSISDLKLQKNLLSSNLRGN